jgi:uncharacterized repeat protein (TIGR01451 family)
MRRLLLPLLFLAGSSPALPAQPPLAPLPAHGPAPLLFVRFDGDPGLRVTLYEGNPLGRNFPAPAVVGLRPGYIYRVKITGLPNLPGVALYPTLEVRGTLHLPPGLQAATYPATFVLTDLDIERVLAGSLVTKVLYLEHPDKAPPIATDKNRPLERDLPPRTDPLEASREFGRPVLVVRLGERELTDDELAHASIPGTVLMPGDRGLAVPRVPPPLAWACFRYWDPVIGHKYTEDECIHDGGDANCNAGIGGDGRLYGLEAEDTVAEYTDARGRRRVTPSNRVCLCVPRFAVLRTETPPAGYDTVLALTQANLVQGQEQMQLRQPPRLTQQYEQPGAIKMRERPSAAQAWQVPGEVSRLQILYAHEIVIGPFALLGTQAVYQLTEIERMRLLKQMELVRQFRQMTVVRGTENVEATSVVGRPEGHAEVVIGSLETQDLTICCGEKPRPPDKPLVLCKWADRCAAEVGDVVTFYLKYSNHGGRPITDVAVSDSLSPRLEYVPASAKADRDTVFTMQPNEAGSLVLRWEISGKLLPGQSGIVSFRARVR